MSLLLLLRLLLLLLLLQLVHVQAIARMERFVLEGRKLNGPPAAREVNATLKQKGLEDQYVSVCYLLIYSLKQKGLEDQYVPVTCSFTHSNRRD